MPKRRVHRHEVTQPLDQSYRLIPLTQGQNAIVDAADYEWLSQWNWMVSYGGNSGKNISAQRKVRDEAAKECFGEFAHLNFP